MDHNLGQIRVRKKNKISGNFCTPRITKVQNLQNRKPWSNTIFFNRFLRLWSMIIRLVQKISEISKKFSRSLWSRSLPESSVVIMWLEIFKIDSRNFWNEMGSLAEPPSGSCYCMTSTSITFFVRFHLFNFDIFLNIIIWSTFLGFVLDVWKLRDLSLSWQR